VAAVCTSFSQLIIQLRSDLSCNLLNNCLLTLFSQSLATLLPLSQGRFEVLVSEEVEEVLGVLSSHLAFFEESAASLVEHSLLVKHSNWVEMLIFCV
jgi:hypothetical protein